MLWMQYYCCHYTLKPGKNKLLDYNDFNLCKKDIKVKVWGGSMPLRRRRGSGESTKSRELTKQRGRQNVWAALLYPRVMSHTKHNMQ